MAAALDEAESSEENGTLNPHGYNVAVNLHLDWLRGERLVLTWSVQGDDPDSGWALDRLGVRFSPTTEHDGGTAYIWVPDLESPGVHTVEVKVYHLAKNALLTSGRLELPVD